MIDHNRYIFYSIDEAGFFHPNASDPSGYIFQMMEDGVNLVERRRFEEAT